MCCWYSVEKTCRILENMKITEPVFKALFSYASNGKFTKDYQIRRILYGLVSILESPTQIPIILQSGIKEIFRILIQLCSETVKINEKSESDSSSDDMENGTEKLLENPAEIDSQSDESFKLSDGNELITGEPILYYTPLDKIHELSYVKNRLELIAGTNMGYYKELENSLSEENKKKLIFCMQKADEYAKELELSK